MHGIFKPLILLTFYKIFVKYGVEIYLRLLFNRYL